MPITFYSELQKPNGSHFWCGVFSKYKWLCDLLKIIFAKFVLLSKKIRLFFRNFLHLKKEQGLFYGNLIFIVSKKNFGLRSEPPNGIHDFWNYRKTCGIRWIAHFVFVRIDCRSCLGLLFVISNWFLFLNALVSL